MDRDVLTIDLDSQPPSSVLTLGMRPDPVPPRAVIDEMAAAWRLGKPYTAADVFARYPNLVEHTEVGVQVIYQEVCLRRRHGLPVDPAEIIRRYPQWGPELESLLDFHQFLERRPSSSEFPRVGETLGDYFLWDALGRGGQGHLFLACQLHLADRPVVLKVTPSAGQEHLSLARLQHSHIVPLYGVQDFPARQLRALCMPYLGGATLDQLLEKMKEKPASQRTGMDWLTALDQLQEESPLALAPSGPARNFLARASYVQAICWIGTCLAEALHYAHERGLVHLDLKPGNVLLASDGQPMLLDFHLAREPVDPRGPVPDWLGGTDKYMAPEHKQAMVAVGQGQPVPDAVDGRADLYSLGVLLYEVLGGTVPLVPDWPQRLELCNSQVSTGLADIIHRCLAVEPESRYASGAALAADLRRHLADLPLQGVPNRNRLERWRKWRRRHPQRLAGVGFLVTLATALVGVALLVQAVWNQRLQGGNRAQAARDLHQVADHIRFLVDPDELTVHQLQELQLRCRAIWESRTRMLDRSQGELEEAAEQELRTDLLDLAIMGTDLRVRLAPAGDMADARRQALQVLEEAETLFGASPALCRQRQAHARALGWTAVAEQAAAQLDRVPARSAWEDCALARLLLRSGDLEAAVAVLEQSSERQPQAFWPHYLLGLCQYRLGRFAEAVHCFNVCVALQPQTPECYYQRALALSSVEGQAARALRDYQRAIELRPDFQEQYPEALRLSDRLRRGR